MNVLHWPTLLKKDGDDLFDHYRHMLESLVLSFRSLSNRHLLAVTIQTA